MRETGCRDLHVCANVVFFLHTSRHITTTRSPILMTKDTPFFFHVWCQLLTLHCSSTTHYSDKKQNSMKMLKAQSSYANF